MTGKLFQDLSEIVIPVRDRQVPAIPYMHTLADSFTLHEILLNEVFPQVLSRSEQQDRSDIKLAAVLNYLTPVNARNIPIEIIEDCLEISAPLDIIRNDDKLLIDVAIAMAAGWHRKVRIGQSTWDEPWKMAIHYLEGVARTAIDVTLSGLEYDNLKDASSGSEMGTRKKMQILGSPRGFRHPGFDQTCHWAAESVKRFLTIPEEEIVETARPRYLCTWEPERTSMSLSHWFALGVLGQPELVKMAMKPGRPFILQTGRFRQGLLFRFMADENGSGHVLNKRAAFLLCHGCESRKREYGESPCLSCGLPLHTTNSFVIHKEILLIPGIYCPRAFRKFVPKMWPEAIQNWRGELYYDDALGECPYEASTVNSRAAHLWIKSEEKPPRDKSKIPVSDCRGPEEGMGVSDVYDSNEPDPLQILTDKEVLSELQQEVDKLPARSKMIIEELYDNGREISTIAEWLDESEDQVKRHLADALVILRHHLAAMI